MNNSGGQSAKAEPEIVLQNTRSALERLAAEAERLRRLSELRSLKESRVKVSVDTLELLATTRMDQVRSSRFATLDEMIHLLCLMAVTSDSDATA